MDKNDRQDGVLNFELGYFSNYHSLDFCFLTSSIKREYKIIKYTDYTNSFPSSINLSYSIDILFSIHKRVDYSYLLYLKTGVNISTMKLHDSIGAVHPVYRFNPKVKVDFGLYL